MALPSLLHGFPGPRLPPLMLLLPLRSGFNADIVRLQDPLNDPVSNALRASTVLSARGILANKVGEVGHRGVVIESIISEAGLSSPDLLSVLTLIVRSYPVGVFPNQSTPLSTGHRFSI